jgi:hypothetical protein
MSNSTNLTLPFLTLGQAQKHVTVNENLLRLDALVQLAVMSATTSAQPGAPSDGQAYILPSGKTGADWAAMANYALAYYRDGIWEQIAPREGWLAFVKDADQLFFYTGAAWSLFPAAKILTVSASDKLLGRVSSGAGAAEEVTFTDQAQQLCDDVSFAAMRTTMGAAGLADANNFAENQTIAKNQSAETKLAITNTQANASAAAKLELASNTGTASLAQFSHESSLPDFMVLSAPAGFVLTSVSNQIFQRNGVNWVSAGANTADLGVPLKLKSYTVATLPAAATAAAGAKAYVTDSNTAVFNATVAGGGANKISVTSDGANWKVG